MTTAWSSWARGGSTAGRSLPRRVTICSAAVKSPTSCFSVTCACSRPRSHRPPTHEATHKLIHRIVARVHRRRSGVRYHLRRQRRRRRPFRCVLRPAQHETPVHPGSAFLTSTTESPGAHAMAGGDGEDMVYGGDGDDVDLIGERHATGDPFSPLLLHSRPCTTRPALGRWIQLRRLRYHLRWERRRPRPFRCVLHPAQHETPTPRGSAFLTSTTAHAMAGGDGDDLVYGGDGDDMYLDGGGGDDVIFSGAGLDVNLVGERHATGDGPFSHPSPRPQPPMHHSPRSWQVEPAPTPFMPISETSKYTAAPAWTSSMAMWMSRS